MPLTLISTQNSVPDINPIPAASGTESLRREFTVNRCQVILNLSPESGEKAIETVKSILLSGCFQESRPKAN